MLTTLFIALWIIGAIVRFVTLVTVVYVLAVLGMNRASARFVGTCYVRF